MASRKPPRFTAHHPFFSADPDQTPLFAVRPGVPLEHALGWASNFLDVAEGLTREAARGVDGPEKPDARLVWAASYLTEISKALVEASLHTAMSERSS